MMYYEDDLSYYEVSYTSGQGQISILSYETSSTKELVDADGKPLKEPEEKKIGFV